MDITKCSKKSENNPLHLLKTVLEYTYKIN